MLIEVKVPQLSESVAEATLLTWHKKPGERVRRDENLVDIETDKVVLETPAPESGVIVRIIKGAGATGAPPQTAPEAGAGARAPTAEGEAKSQAKPPAKAAGEASPAISLLPQP